jgi:hypothetical protein
VKLVFNMEPYDTGIEHGTMWYWYLRWNFLFLYARLETGRIMW